MHLALAFWPLASKEWKDKGIWNLSFLNKHELYWVEKHNINIIPKLNTFYYFINSNIIIHEFVSRANLQPKISGVKG